VDSNLGDLKRDFAALLACYQDLGGVPTGDRNHNPCPICQDETAFMLVEANKVSGKPYWQCFHCHRKGGLVDLVAAARNVDPKEAIRWVLERFGRRVAGSAGGGAGSACDTRTDANSPPASGGRAASGSGASDSAPVNDFPKKKPKKVHQTIDDAAKACAWGLEQRKNVENVREFARWRYQRTEADPGFYVVRYDFEHVKDDKRERCKEIRFIRYASGGWITDKGEWGGGGQLCPVLYLPSILAALDNVSEGTHTRIHVVEGEKCAQAMREAGMMATTSQGGSGRAAETDWAPLARFKRVIIWPDCDEPGAKYMADVARAIRASGQDVQIDVVYLQELGFKNDQDVFDFIAEMKAEGKERPAIAAELSAVVTRLAVPWLEPLDAVLQGQPAPFDPDKVDRGHLPEVANWQWIAKRGVNEKGEDVEERKQEYIPIREIVRRVVEIGAGWPCRLRAKHARNPSLFLDQVAPGAEGDIRFFDRSEQFGALLHEMARPSFREKMDYRCTNYVSKGELLNALGNGAGIQEYVQPEIRPHWPPYKDHYYAYRPAGGYQPTGKALVGFLQFFDNFADGNSRAIAAAAALTPAWGGPYGRRPLFVVKGRQTGSGKTTFASKLGEVWGGVFGAEMGQRSEDQLRERLLSYESLFMRIGLLDNVAGYLRTELVERLLTSPQIDGKRMYVGQASRPNTLCWFLTTNSFRISTDMAHRVFVIEVNPPSSAVTRWDERLRVYIEQHLHEIVADSIAILRWAPPVVDVGIGDRWAEWVDAVLVRAVTHPVLARWVGEGTSVKGVLEANRAQRDEYDADKSEGLLWDQQIVEIVATSKEFDSVRRHPWVDMEAGVGVVREPKTADGSAADVWIPSPLMCDAWEMIFEKRFGPKELRPMINAHLAAGRIKSIGPWQHTRDGNGCMLLASAISQWAEWKAQQLAEAAKNG
jgi:5S rRNA maturation endonuclease (ribonuclease M5)